MWRLAFPILLIGLLTIRTALGSDCTTAADCDDLDPCTDDACTSVDGAFVCTHADNTSPCDDGNRCTVDDACLNDTCVGMPDLGTCHFQCYEVKAAPFSAATPVLADDFTVASLPVQRPDRLCAPADKNGEDPGAPSEPIHLQGHRLRGAMAGVVDQPVVDQFGTLFLDVTALDRLFVPAAKSLTAPPASPSDPTVDHFDCYKVRRTKGRPAFVRRTVTAEDQFGTATLVLTRPDRLCVPVDKNSEKPGAENDPGRLLCYKSIHQAGAPSLPIHVFTNDQFGPAAPTLIDRKELCVPAVTPRCDDEVQDGLETDLDCGGPYCPSCSLGRGCRVGSDCTSGVCGSGFCQSPSTCDDALQDGDETDVDCGGPFCDPCDTGKTCTRPADCMSDVCSGGVCQPSGCADGVQNGDETDVDCGGSTCAPCPSGGSCLVDGDCDSDDCGTSGFCGAAPPPPPPQPCTCNTCTALMQGRLPSPLKCTPTSKPTDVPCNGWTPSGALDDPDDISGSSATRAAHFFKDFSTTCGDFRCSYLPRWNTPVPGPLVASKKVLHGLLCFNTSTCETCAYDRQAEDDPNKDVPFAALDLQKAPPTRRWTITNRSGAARSDLHLDFANSGGSTKLAGLRQPPACGAPTATNPGTPWDITWPNACIATSASVTLRFDKPITFTSGHWTPGNVALANADATPEAPGSACGTCHRPGPILPKRDLWLDARKHLTTLNDTCVKQGGPKWLCLDGVGGFPAPDPLAVVKASDVSPALNNRCANGCHANGFMPTTGNPRYCSTVRAAFLPGGSMRSRGFPTFLDCAKFMDKMKCEPLPSLIFCALPGVVK